MGFCFRECAFGGRITFGVLLLQSAPNPLDRITLKRLSKICFWFTWTQLDAPALLCGVALRECTRSRDVL